MKNAIQKTVTLVVISMMFFLSMTTNTSAQHLKGNRKDYFVKNLVACINSENPGVQKSAIYFAGKYQVPEVIPELMKQLKSHNDSSTRILIGLTIYTIGNQEGMEQLRKAAEKDNDTRVKNLLMEICNVYSAKTNIAVTLN